MSLRNKNRLPDDLLERFRNFIAEQMGLHFGPDRRAELEHALGAAAHALGCRNAEECLWRMLEAPLSRQQVEMLAARLTVGETYFFREHRVYEILAEQVLPPLIAARRREGKRLRIWSAACASGEEPYSIAMLLDRLLPDLDEWNVTLLATDINADALRRAAEGVYRDWSFRRVPDKIKERYFRQVKPGHYELEARFKRLVTFGYLNLAADSYPSLLGNTNAMDLIFCRNVLLYFTPERLRHTVECLHHCLVDGGWLVVSQTEVSHTSFAQFEAVHFPDAIFYHKTGQQAGAVDTWVKAPPRLWGTDEAEIEPTLTVSPPDDGQATDAPLSPAADAALQPAAEDWPMSWLDAAPEAVPDAAPGLTAEAEQAECDAPVELFRQGDYAAAEEHLRRLIAARPDNVRAIAFLARACANQGKLDEASKWCARAVAADKLNARYYYLQAMVAEERGRTEEAVQSLRRALFLEPDFVLAHFALGLLAAGRGHRLEADRHYANALWLLESRPADEVLPEGDGLTVGWLTEVIRATRLNAERDTLR